MKITKTELGQILEAGAMAVEAYYNEHDLDNEDLAQDKRTATALRAVRLMFERISHTVHENLLSRINDNMPTTDPRPLAIEIQQDLAHLVVISELIDETYYHTLQQELAQTKEKIDRLVSHLPA